MMRFVILCLLGVACTGPSSTESQTASSDETFTRISHKGRIQASNIEEVKAQIMSAVLKPAANLAHHMGYGWCAGNRPQDKFVGDGFKRTPRGWKAIYGPDGKDGYMKDQRLEIVFSDWSFGMKEIHFGKPVINDSEPRNISTSTIDNWLGEKDLVRRFNVDVAKSTTHSHMKSTSFNWGSETAIEKSVGIPLIGQAKVTQTFKFGGEVTNGYTDSETKTLNTSELVVGELPKFSRQEYSIVILDTKSSVDYTAIMEVRFSVEFRGFLRWGGGKGKPESNYHMDHHGSEDRPTVNYKFGSNEVSFFEDLTNKQKNDIGPWDWARLKKEHPQVQRFINQLVAPYAYTFPVDGRFQMVDGNHTNIKYHPIEYNEEHWKTETAPKTEVPDAGGTKDPKQCQIDDPRLKKEWCMDPLFDPTGACCLDESTPDPVTEEPDQPEAPHNTQKPLCIKGDTSAIVVGLSPDIGCALRTDKSKALLPRSSQMLLRDTQDLKTIELYKTHVSTDFCLEYIGHIPCEER